MIAAPLARAAPGDLAAEFARGGVAPLESVPSPTGMAVAPDGSIVVVGLARSGDGIEGVVSRLTAAGSLDSSFGVGGTTTFELAATGAGPTEVVVDSQGRTIIVGGASTGAFAIRLAANGLPDPAFGLNGRVDEIGPLGPAYGVALTASDQVLLTAPDRQSEDQLAFGVARLSEDGSLDPTFGAGGIAFAPVANAGGSFGGADLDVSTDGSILFGARKLARLTPDGQLDLSFGVDGIAEWEANFTSRVDSIAETDNRIVVGYQSCNATGPSAGCSPVAATFDHSGALVKASPSRIGTAFTADGRGSFLAAGVARAGLPATTAIRRVSGALQPQRVFGANGVARVYAGLRPVTPLGITTAPAGDPVVLGYLEAGPTIVAKLEIGSGPHDADGDGFSDKRDRCALGFSADKRGCPTASRRLSLRSHADRVAVRVHSNSDACVTGTRVILSVVKNGDSSRVAAKTVHGGSTVSFPTTTNAVYSAAAASSFTDLARCPRASAP